MVELDNVCLNLIFHRSIRQLKSASCCEDLLPWLCNYNSLRDFHWHFRSSKLKHMLEIKCTEVSDFQFIIKRSPKTIHWSWQYSITRGIITAIRQKPDYFFLYTCLIAFCFLSLLQCLKMKPNYICNDPTNSFSSQAF